MEENNNTEILADVVSSKKKTPVIIGAVVAVVAGCAAASYAFVPAVKNAVNMTFMKPENYCTYVYENAIDSALKSVEDTEESNAVDMSVNLELDEDILNELRETTESDLFNKISFTASSIVSGNDTSADITVMADGKKVITASALKIGDMAYVQIPEASEKYLTFDFAEALDSYEVNLSPKTLSVTDVSDIMQRYSGIFTGRLPEMESTLEKGYTGSIDNLEYKFNRITTTITAEDARYLLEKTADELGNDQLILDIINSNSTEDYDIGEELVTSIKEEAENITSDSTLYTLVDANGEIRGMTVAVEDGQIGYVMAKNGSDVGFELIAPEGGIVLKAEESNNAYTGSAKLSSEDEEIVIDFENLEIIDDKYISGKISTDVSELSDGEIQILEIAFEKENDMQSMSTIIDGVGKISLEYKTYKSDDKNITAPENTISADNIEEYLSEVDTEKLLEDVLETLGLNEESIYSLIYGMSAYD